MSKEVVLRASDTIIDRRLSGKNKSIGNRERFLRRHKDQIREAVQRAINGRNIKDVGKDGEDVHVPKRDINEPVFGHGSGGTSERVHPGNEEFLRGDRIKRPKKSDGHGHGASDSGEGNDDFHFYLSKEEFMQVFFDDLALPNLERTSLADSDEYKSVRAGYANDGTPNNLALVKSMGRAIGRKLVFGKRAKEAELALLEAELEALDEEQGAPVEEHAAARNVLLEKIGLLRSKIASIHYLDPIDVRYRSRVRVPVPYSKAVMFCLMDISGSMDEERKNLSKRFFILLYLFLTRHYEKIDIVFIRHHTQAQEVDEQNFFHATETGGTVVSSALVLMGEIVRARYLTGEWNIYGAQASDGDNFHNDSPRCEKILTEQLLPICRYFAYIQVAEEEQNLWEEYEKIECTHFAMRKVSEAREIYPVFRELFKKEGAT